LCLCPAIAAGRAQEPCGADCGQAQVVAAASQLDRDRNQFVAAVRQLIEAVPDASGGDGNAVASAVDQLARALAGWDKSIRTYRAVLLEAADRAADAHVALAGVYLERGNGREALKEAQAARALDPQRADGYILQGLAYDLAKRPADAALAFSNASKLSPRSAAAAYGLAQRLIASGDEAGAAAALRRFETSQSAARPDANAPARGPASPFVRVGLLRQPAGVAPLFPPAAYVKAFARLADGDFEQAIAEFRTVAARAGSPLQDDDMREGAAALRRGDLRSAIARASSAVERYPDRPEPRRLLGLAYRADEQYDRSVEHLAAAVRLNPSDDLARQALADVFVLARRPADAERVLLAAIDAIPDAGGAHYQLALVLQSAGRNADAIRELERAAEFSPVVGQDHLYDTLGVLYTSDANMDGALAAYRKRVLANPNNSDAHRKLAQIYLELGRHEEASAEFTAALLLDPMNAEAFAGRAQIRLRLGDYTDAVKWAQAALMLNPAHAAARYTLGTSLMRLGRADEGAAALEEFRRLQAASQAAASLEWELKLLRLSAQARIDDGHFGEAAVLLQQVAARQPDVAANHVNLGLALERAGRYEAAVDAYRKAVALNADASVHGRLAAAYAALGRAQESQAEQALYDRAKESRVRARGPGR
jgi:tetratricopeptide (TPR) repeat protein